MDHNQHPSDDELEAYVMGTLPGQAALVECHLAICFPCRHRLQEMDEYVTTMRTAAVELRRKEKPTLFKKPDRESTATFAEKAPGLPAVLPHACVGVSSLPLKPRAWRTGEPAKKR